MTEDEAKKKVCQRAPICVTMQNVDSISYLNYDHETIMCIGSQCMMWRWDKDSVSKNGYCGLGGKP